MREPQEKTIDGTKYRVAPLPASKGLAILTMITKVVGPSLVAAPSLAALAGGAAELFGDVCERLDEAQVERLSKAMAGHTLVEASPGKGGLVPLGDHFDLHFAGDYGAMLQWMQFALEVNYGGFFDAVRAKSSAAAPASVEPAPSTK